jgi:hypothetical protein
MYACSENDQENEDPLEHDTGMNEAAEHTSKIDQKIKGADPDQNLKNK